MSDEEIGPPETFGAALRRMRTAKGVSLRALGMMVHYSKGHLSKIETGAAAATIRLAQECDTALSADGALSGIFLAGMSHAALDLGAPVAETPFDIPAAANHFTGRIEDVTQVVEAILKPSAPGRAPVVLIHGMPGVGKTELAVQAAYTLRTRFPGGCMYVDFGSPANPRSAPDVLVWLLRRLGVAGDAIPAEPDEARALYLSLLYRRRVLIVADNVTRSDQVMPLVSGSTACAMVVVSRRRLGALDDCHQIRLRPLSAGDSAALFRAVAGGRSTAEPEADLARIAEACGGLPLAVRVAAAKFRDSGRSAADLARRLESPATAWDELDDDERSLQRVIRTAFEDLPANRQRALVMLSLHPAAHVSSHAAAWLADSPADAVVTELARLQEHNLVSVDADGLASAHELVRVFASGIADRLDEGSRRQALHRLVTGYLRTAMLTDSMITPTRYRPPDLGHEIPAEPVPLADMAQVSAWCRLEADHIPLLCRLAHDQGLDAECWRLAYAMRSYFFTAKAVEPWIASHSIAVASAERSRDAWAEAVTRNNLGMAFIEQGRIARAEAEYDRAMEIWRALEDRRGIAATLGHQAWAHHAAGRDDRAATLAEEAVALTRQHGPGDPRTLAIMNRTAALAYSGTGRYDRALECLAEAQTLLSGLQLPLDVAMTLNCLGEVYFAMGRFAMADDFHTLAGEQSVACGSVSERARAFKGLAVTASAIGQDVLAEGLYQQAISLYATFDPMTAAKLAEKS